MSANRPVHIGTSGWEFEHWKGPFYPEDATTSDLFDLYREQFSTTELTDPFYRLPEAVTVQRWGAMADGSFLFSVQASRAITHVKKLEAAEDAVGAFFDRMTLLGGNLGPVLFVLPSSLPIDPPRLEAFLQMLPTKFRYAFEFGHPSWFDDEVYTILVEHNAAFCIYDREKTTSPPTLTADFVYVRLQGGEPAKQARYGTKELKLWAKRVRRWSAEREVFCYFTADQEGFAVLNALELSNLVAQTENANIV